MCKLHAVVVTYNPNESFTVRQIQKLTASVEKVWLIDNASRSLTLDQCEGLKSNDKLEQVSLPVNVGVGAAQNLGIHLASAAGATHVLLLDQDSEPLEDMIENLMSFCSKLCNKGIKFAAVAPTYKHFPQPLNFRFMRIGWFGYRAQPISDPQEMVEADLFISSGMIIPLSVIEDIGLMDAGLFIDHIDTDWCLRARSKGYRLFGVPSAHMNHSLGYKRKQIWFLRWRNIAFHSPFRYYYMLRNSMLLQRRAYIPFRWKVAEVFRCFRLILFFGLLGERRLNCVNMMFKGIWHGIKGVRGPLKI